MTDGLMTGMQDKPLPLQRLINLKKIDAGPAEF